MSTEQIISWFDLDGIGKSAARFDFDKLEALNGHYIRHSNDEALVQHIEALLPELENGAALMTKLDDGGREKLLASMPGLKERTKTLTELISSAHYLFAERPLQLDTKAQKLLSDDGKAALNSLSQRLDALDGWTAAAIEAEVRAFAEAEDLKLGKVAQPLRAALTGTSVSPPIFDVMAILGREEALARIKDQSL